MFQWAAGINQPAKYGDTSGDSNIKANGTKIEPNDGPCADCGGTRRHLDGCSLDDVRGSLRWTGSPIKEDDEIPCHDCGGTYVHAFDCDEDPGSRPQGSWHITKDPVKRVTCQICFAENGHRVTCPFRAALPICKDCGATKDSSHTDRMCLVKQAIARMRINAPTEGPCDECAGQLTHYWPCSKIVTLGGHKLN